MTRRRQIILLAGIFFVGVAIGTAFAPPEVVTETVVETEVVTETITETVVQEVVPRSCIEALDLAAEFSAAIAPLPSMITEAAVAGLAADADAMEALAARALDINARIAELNEAIGPAASDCRSKAQ